MGHVPVGQDEGRVLLRATTGPAACVTVDHAVGYRETAAATVLVEWKDASGATDGMEASRSGFTIHDLRFMIMAGVLPGRKAWKRRRLLTKLLQLPRR